MKIRGMKVILTIIGTMQLWVLFVAGLSVFAPAHVWRSQAFVMLCLCDLSYFFRMQNVSHQGQGQEPKQCKSVSKTYFTVLTQREAATLTRSIKVMFDHTSTSL